MLEVLEAALDTPLTALFADGGAMRSDLLAQITADVTGLPVIRDRSDSLAAVGAAYLAGLAIGTWVVGGRGPRPGPGPDRVDPRPSVRSADDGYAGLAGGSPARRRQAGGVTWRASTSCDS